MSHQHDLDELVAWRAIGRLEAGQTQFVVAHTLVSQSVISKLWNRFLETESVHKSEEQGCTLATTQN